MVIVRIFLSFICTLCFSMVAFSQDWSGTTYKYNEIHPGYIVSLSGDTTRGYLEFGNRTATQKSCIFYTDASKKEKKKYGPDDISAYGVAVNHYRSIHFTGGLTAKPLGFVLLLKPGRLAQYMYYSKKDGVSDFMGKNETYAEYDARINQDEIVWQKLDEKPIQQGDFLLGFAKKMAKLTEDYPELSEKVANKEKGYGLMSIYAIADEYNAWWEKKK